MVDTTAWANVQLPSSRNLASESFLRSAAIGQLVGEQKRKTEKEANVDALRKNILDAYKIGDRSKMMYGISELARYDPDAAQRSKDILGNLDRTNAFQAAMLVYTAAASETEEAQDTALKQAIDALNVGPTHPFFTELSDIMAMPFGKEKDAKLFQSVQTAQQLGVLPSSESGQPTKGDDIAERRLMLAEEEARWRKEFQSKSLGLRQDEVSLKQHQQYLAETNLSEADKKIYGDTLAEWSKLNARRNQLNDLINRFDLLEKEGVRGGFPRYVANLVADFTGKGDKSKSLAYRMYNDIRTSEAISRLPKGSSSDQDVKFSLLGTPPETASPAYVKLWLKQVKRLGEIDNFYNKAKLNWMQEHPMKGVVGFDNFWNEKGYDLLKSANLLSGKPGGEPDYNMKSENAIKFDMVETNLEEYGKELRRYNSLEEAENAYLLDEIPKDVTHFLVGDEIYKINR